MHKAYNPYKPVACKLLQKRWDEKQFNNHRKHVNILFIDSIKPIQIY